MEPKQEKLIDEINTGMEKCPRIVRRHKYERLTQNNQIWWNKKFQELETNIRIPWHKKFSELKNVFTKAELKSLQAAGLTYGDDEKEIEDKYKSSKRSCSKRRTFQSKIYVPHRRSSLPVKRDFFVDRLVDFYEKTPADAKIWSPKHKRNLNDSVHLLERAAIVEETLAEDFDKWFSNIKTFTASEINKETILKIFEINSSLAIHTSIVVNMQLIKSVPDQVAKYLGDSELGSSAVIKREIDSDIKISKIQPITVAFSRCLPPNLRTYKHKSDNKLKMGPAHKDLETFAAVFQDIMELETTKKFVSWLRNHPTVSPPPILRKSCTSKKKRMPKRSIFLRQIYEAKVWKLNTHSGSSSSDKSQLSNTSGSLHDDSYSSINFFV